MSADSQYRFATMNHSRLRREREIKMDEMELLAVDQGIEWNGMKERQLQECEARITKLERPRDLAARSTATLRAEGIAKNERIKQLEAQLRNPEREPPHCPSCSCGLAAQPIYPDPDPIDVAPPCDTLETPPHLRGPIIQAHADTNGVPPQSETPVKAYVDSDAKLPSTFTGWIQGPCENCGRDR